VKSSPAHISLSFLGSRTPLDRLRRCMLRKAAILASITQAPRDSPFAGQTLADEVTGCGMTGHATLIAEQIRISQRKFGDQTATLGGLS
jgi:hypothetical protein